MQAATPLLRAPAGVVLACLLALAAGCTPEEGTQAGDRAAELVASYRERFPMPSGPWSGIGTTTPRRAMSAQQEREWLTEEAREPTPELHRDLGMLYTSVEEHERGMAWLLRAWDENPNHPHVWLWMGVNRLSAGETDEAIALLEHAEALDTELARKQRRNPDPRIPQSLAEAWYRKGEDLRAREAYQRALLSKGDYPEALEGLARLLVDTGDLDAALPRIKRLLAIDPDSPTGLWLMVRVLEQQGDAAGAAEYRILHERATLLDDLGQRASGLPRSGQAVNLGIHYMQTDELDEAVAEFQLALRELAQSTAETEIEQLGNAEIEAEALARLTATWLRLGRSEDARKSLARLEAMTDELGQPHRMLESLRREIAAEGER